jgi:hypothetical protein
MQIRRAPNAVDDRPAWAAPRLVHVRGREIADFQAGVGADDEFFATPAS